MTKTIAQRTVSAVAAIFVTIVLIFVSCFGSFTFA